MSNIVKLSFIIAFLFVCFLSSSCTEIIEGEIQNISSTEYRGTVCFKNFDCDYVVICLDDGSYILIDDYFDECQDGDIIEGRLKKRGYDDAFNVTQNQVVKIYIEKLDFSREIAVEEWQRACRDDELYKDRGVVCLKNSICDYIIVCLEDSKYSIVEDYNNAVREGDVLIGRFQNYGIDYVYNVTRDEKLKINVDAIEFLESRATQAWEEECADSESDLERGTVCLKTFDCDYMIVCLDNGNYSIVEDRNNVCREGDILLGEFETSGLDDAYNVTRNRNIRVDIEEWESSEETTREKWEGLCD